MHFWKWLSVVSKKNTEVLPETSERLASVLASAEEMIQTNTIFLKSYPQHKLILQKQI